MRLNRLLSLIFSLALLAAAATPAPAEIPPAAAQATGQAAKPVSPDVELLLRVLQDDGARARLIEALRAEAPGANPAAPEPLRNEIARGLSAWTQGAGQQGAALVEGLNKAAVEAMSLSEAATRYGRAALVEAGVALGATIALAFALLWLARRAIALIFRPNRGAKPVDAIARRLLSAFVELAAGAVAIMIATAGGLGLLTALKPDAAVQAASVGFLAAFAITEAIKLMVRAIFAPAHPAARLPPVSDTSASYWTIWLSRVAVAIVYPLVFVAPALARADLPEIAQATVVLAIATAALISMTLALQNRAAVRERLDARARALGGGGVAHFYMLFGRTWHVFAIVAIAAMAALSLTQPERALAYVLASVIESVIIIAIGRIATLFISRALGRGMTLPPEIRERLPLLEIKLNAFVPAILRVVRWIVVALVIAAIVRAWGAFDAFAWLSTPAGVLLVATLISTGLILVVGFLAYIIVTSWIEYRLNPAFGAPPSQRERTLLALFRSAFIVALTVAIGMMALAELGVNIGPLLAGAGVVGLAIGFGAQKLVQDVITGVFIQLENVMNEGDVVTAGGISGVVEKLTIRSVGLRDLSGAYHSIPFSTVDKVTNMMRHFAFYLADVGVAYRENMTEVKAALEEAFDRLAASPEHAVDIIGPFEMMGVDRFEDSAVIVRCRVKTLPGKQWATGRAFNELIKEVFDERGIEIPFPHITLYAGQNKDGSAPPLRIAPDGEEQTPELAGKETFVSGDNAKEEPSPETTQGAAPDAPADDKRRPADP